MNKFVEGERVRVVNDSLVWSVNDSLEAYGVSVGDEGSVLEIIDEYPYNTLVQFQHAGQILFLEQELEKVGGLLGE